MERTSCTKGKMLEKHRLTCDKFQEYTDYNYWSFQMCYLVQ